MQDELTASGRERWQALAGEAAGERRARAVLSARRTPFRERLAVALVALAARVAPAAWEMPDWMSPCPSCGGRETSGAARALWLAGPADQSALYQGSGRISLN